MKTTRRETADMRRDGQCSSRVSRLAPMLVSRLSSLALCLAALSSFAFDSDEWFGKREVLSREAERLQAAYTSCVARIVQPATDVKLPVESHPDGSIKAVVTAKRAQFFIDTGYVWGADVVVSQLTTNGTVEAQVTADNCVIDRSTKSGWVEGHVHAQYMDNIVEGDGIYFSFEEEFITITSNTVVRAKGQKIGNAFGADGKRPGGKGKHAAKNAQRMQSAPRDAEVLACRTDFDRKDGVILFCGDVRASDAEYALGADRLFVFLDGTNSLKRIVADGAVTITNGLRSGSCARATYAKALGRVAMYGDGATLARLEEGGRRRNTVEGRKITFWQDSEQVEVEGAALTVDGGITEGRDGALGRLVK